MPWDLVVTNAPKIPSSCFEFDARPGVFHLDNNGVAPVQGGAHLQQAFSVGCRGHGLERIVGQIEDDFPQLTAMGGDLRQLGRQLCANDDASILRLTAERP